MLILERPDVGIDEFCDAVRGFAAVLEGRTSDETWPATGLQFSPVSRARDGLSWVLRRTGVGPGDEVIMPALECPAMADAVTKVGARVAVCGLEAGGFVPSVEAYKATISPATRAMLVPHLFGIQVSMAPFRQLADERGLLLIEDAAHLQPMEAPVDVARGDCLVLSYNVAKPASVGWGGAIGLTAALLAQVGEPPTRPMSEERDRQIAAGFLLACAATGLARTTSAGKADFPYTPKAPFCLDFCFPFACEHADEILKLATSEDGARRLEAWCSGQSILRKTSVNRYLTPRMKVPLRYLSSRSYRPKQPLTTAPDPDALLGETLRDGGLCAVLLATQRRYLKAGSFTRRRCELATRYSEWLDPERWIVGVGAPYPVAVPVAARARRGRIPRDQLVVRATRELEIDIFPWMWPDALCSMRRLQNVVRRGSGAVETEGFVNGLLNLPAHSFVTKQMADDIIGLLNKP